MSEVDSYSGRTRWCWLLTYRMELLGEEDILIEWARLDFWTEIARPGAATIAGTLLCCVGSHRDSREGRARY